MPADSRQMQAERNAEGQFVKGRSGNPAGRVPGTRNRATVLAEQLLDGACGALANKAVADGVLSTGEAWELGQFVDTFIRAIEAGEFDARLQRLEAVNGLAL